jgi:hypothetical protein
MYTTGINAALKASGPIKAAMDTLATGFGWPTNAEQMGVVSVPIFSAYTTATTTIGTMTTNGSSNTYASMSLANASVTDKRLPTQWSGLLADPENIRIMMTQMADGLRQQALVALLNGMLAATPTTKSTLTAGYANFEGCTAVEIALAVAAVNGVASYNSGSYEGMVGLMYPAAWSNFSTGVSVLMNNPSFIDATRPFHFIIPWVPVTDDGTTNWGAVSDNCAYIIQSRGYGLKQADAFSQYPSIPWPAGDGSHEITMHAPYVHGSINVNLQGEILNAAS